MFAVSKIIGALSDPFVVLFSVLTVSAALLFTRRWRLGRAVIIATLGMWGALAALPLSDWLIAPLEDRFAPPDSIPDDLEGIIVLGGAVNPIISAARNRPALGGAAERVTSMVELARRYPLATLVYTGGSGSLRDQDKKEAPFARDLLQSMGVDTGRIIFEDQSRNTRENAVFSRALAAPDGKRPWLLVTSAMHMPRAMGVFQADGWKVIAYPVDYATAGKGGDSASAGLRGVQAGLHEWLGLAYYRWRGWM